DLLFGSCQNVFTRALNGENRFKLETRQIERLEEEIRRLIRAGFTWKDAYTQCTLQNTLLEFRHGRTFNRHLCEDALGVASPDWSDDVNSEIATVLLQLLESGKVSLDDLTSQGQADRDLDLFNSNKRDEIVQIHKYFDKSTGQLKRDPHFDPPYGYLEQSDDAEKDPGYRFRDAQPDGDDDRDTYPSYKSRDDGDGLQPSDLQALQTIAEGKDLSNFLEKVASDRGNPTEAENAQGRFYYNNDKDEEGESALDLLLDTIIVTPADKFLLEQLLTGTIRPADLTDEQQQRMQTFISVLIRVLEDKDSKGTAEEGQAIPSLESQASSKIGQGVTIEDELLTEVKPLADDIPNQGHDDARNEEADIIKAAVVASPNVLVDKKTVAEDDDPESQESEKLGQEVEATSKTRAVDSHSMYLQLSKELSTPDGLQFVQNLTEILNLPPGLVYLVQVGPGRMISLEVNTDPHGKWDAEKIAKEAQNVNELLKKATGINIEGAGVGRDGNRVEVKQNNRYVVLTFILVGTIAGVVLAVVTIYLIKRHARSKQKLTQLSTTA
ncbi:unnamed protein product, partial [Lymnaea stagnalis]